MGLLCAAAAIGLHPFQKWGIALKMHERHDCNCISIWKCTRLCYLTSHPLEHAQRHSLHDMR